MKKSLKIFKGCLILDDNNEYIIGEDNLSKCLNRIYMSNVNNFIDIGISSANFPKINEYGELYLKKDTWGVFDYFINDFALGVYLHNHTGEKLAVSITYAEEEAES